VPLTSETPFNGSLGGRHGYERDEQQRQSVCAYRDAAVGLRMVMSRKNGDETHS
jgi:hypothetical protein